MKIIKNVKGIIIFYSVEVFYYLPISLIIRIYSKQMK